MTSLKRTNARTWITCALLGLLLGTLILGTGCRTRSGSREFVPGRGWVPND